MVFYLVQRLESKKTVDPARGFDGRFSLDYMGSSEFEWGAIPKALKAMREKPVVERAIEVRIDGSDRVVWFVGHDESLEDHAKAMEKWAVGNGRVGGFYGKEASHFPEVLRGEPDFRTTDAWWAIEEGVAWAISPEVARSLVLAFNTRPVES